MRKSLVIIPTYNEAENIEQMIAAIMQLKQPFDLLVIDDNSPDGTGFLVQSFALKNSKKVFLLSRDNKDGLGKAYTDGFNWALKNNYNYIFEMDADFSHDPIDLVRLHNELCISNFDLVIGSRYINGINVVNWPLSRIILSYFASFYSRIITGMPVKDATSGFVGYKAKVLKAINLDSIMFNGYAFQIELKFKAFKKKFKMQEIPIIFKDRIYGESKMNGNIIFEAIFGLIIMRFKSLFNK